jgi:sterol desaturase/sphingolipid hydroxylase (fatty acid hydroxylase superfamily)
MNIEFSPTVHIEVGVVLFGTVFVFGILYYLTRQNQNHSKREMDKEYMNNILANFGKATLLALTLVIFRLHLFEHGFLPRIGKILVCLLMIDGLSYWTHRITHRTPFLKQLIHTTHHDAFHLIPFDSFYQTAYDFFIYFFYIGIVPILLGVNFVESAIVFLLILVHSVYTHSETESDFFLPAFISSKFHTEHHQIGRGNYGIIFPFWDDYMKTRIQVTRPVAVATVATTDADSKKEEKPHKE